MIIGLDNNNNKKVGNKNNMEIVNMKKNSFYFYLPRALVSLIWLPQNKANRPGFVYLFYFSLKCSSFLCVVCVCVDLLSSCCVIVHVKVNRETNFVYEGRHFEFKKKTNPISMAPI